MKTQNTQLKPAGPRSASTSAGLLIGSNAYWVAVLALFFAGAILLSTSAASAATITVINTNDSGPGSLRQALVGANDGDTINFDSSLNGQRITLTSGELIVDKDVAISGPGANNLAVDGNAQSRVFDINPGNTVTIDGLTVANGRANSFGSGGGIYNNVAALTVTNCTFSGNSATNGGGGIANSNANSTLTVTNCTFSGNSAVHGGGAIGNLATLTVTNCTISGNSASFGALANRAFSQDVATLTVTNCTISGNISTSVFSGGVGNIADSEGSATLTIANRTISGNSASSAGGGICNLAQNAGSATLTIANCTISGNSASSGGGLANLVLNAGSAAVETGNTIFDAGSSGENIYNSAGTITSLGYNVSSDDGAGFLTGAGDQNNTDPLLGPLQDNGGCTRTIALLAGSPAINTGAPAAPLQDQRYYLRSGAPDIGAFEFGGTLAPVSAVTRKAQGASNFDINLPMAGTAGIECRSGGATNDYQLVLNFPTSVTFTSASVTTGVGGVTSSSVSGAEVTVNLSGVTNAQRIVVTFFGVSDGTNTSNVAIPMGILLGDTNGNGSVNASDVAQTKGQSGQAVTAANFREDVNANGSINAGDVALVKSKSGTSLP